MQVHGNAPATGGQQPAGTRRARLQQAIQEFEGMLWNQVLQQMNRVQLGPRVLGSGGRVYQRMFLRTVSRRYASRLESSLTRVLERQLDVAAPVAAPRGQGPSYAEVAAAAPSAAARQAGGR